MQVGTLALLGACYDKEVRGVVDLDRFSDLLKTQEKYRERTRDRLEFNLAMGRWIKAIPPVWKDEDRPNFASIGDLNELEEGRKKDAEKEKL